MSFLKNKRGIDYRVYKIDPAATGADATQLDSAGQTQEPKKKKKKKFDFGSIFKAAAPVLGMATGGLTSGLMGGGMLGGGDKGGGNPLGNMLGGGDKGGAGAKVADAGGAKGIKPDAAKAAPTKTAAKAQAGDTKPKTNTAAKPQGGNTETAAAKPEAATKPDTPNSKQASNEGGKDAAGFLDQAKGLIEQFTKKGEEKGESGEAEKGKEVADKGGNKKEELMMKLEKAIDSKDPDKVVAVLKLIKENAG